MSDSGELLANTQPLSQEEVLGEIARLEEGPWDVAFPHVTFMSVDARQRLVWEASNQFRIQGVAAGAFGKAFHLITIDGRTLKVLLRSGEGPLAVAHRIRAALTKGYSASIRTGRPITAWASISFWRRNSGNIQTR